MDLGIDKILEWARSNGAHIDPLLKFQYAPDKGVSAIYTKTLTEPSTSPQLQIPLNLILTNALSNEYFGKPIETGNANSSLKLFLAKLKYDVSDGWTGAINYQRFFAPYVDLLPVGEQTGSVFYWNEDETRLLDNTNLGGSIMLKLQSLLDEWKDSILALPEKYLASEQFRNDLSFYEKFPEADKDQILSELLNIESWTSFGAYVWSSFIFTSRAFPNHIINSKVKDGQAILLPVLDLLNHENTTKINWDHTVSDNNEYFSLKSLELLQEGEEIFNNYGAKGNEELLMGYGFVIEDNPNDSIALRIKLPIDTVRSAVLFGVKIPTIDDYTYHSFQNSNQVAKAEDSEINDEDIKDGILYFINKQSLVPDNLLSIFQFLVKNPNELKSTLRSKLGALQSLKQALEQKEKLLRNDGEISHSIDEAKLKKAQVYRLGQQKLYKLSINEIKAKEKSILQEHKSHVFNLKKVYKKDTKLQDLLANQLNITNYESIEAEDMIDAVYFIWLILHGESLSEEEYSAPDWIVKQYKQLKEVSADGISNGEFKNLEAFLQQHLADTDVVPYLTEKNLNIANQILSVNSYTRLNTNEIILVEPIEL